MMANSTPRAPETGIWEDEAGEEDVKQIAAWMISAITSELGCNAGNFVGENEV